MKQKQKEVTKKSLVSFYAGVMVLFYLGYVLLDNYRLHQSEKWKVINNLSLQNVQDIQQLMFMNTVLEGLFIGLFLIVTVFLYKKHKEKLVHFIRLNTFLFASLFLMSYILSFFLQLPFGNLIQPLFLPTFMLVLLMFYCLFISLKHRLIRSV